MAKVSLYLRTRITSIEGKTSQPYCKAVWIVRGRLKKYWCLVKGVEEYHPEGTYCLRYKLNGKNCWETVSNLQDPADALKYKQSEIKGKKFSKPLPTVAVEPKTKSFTQWRDDFLVDKRSSRKPDGTPLDADTIHSYELVTEEFLTTIKKKTPDQLTKSDLKLWIAKRHEVVGHRTVCNHYFLMVVFLHFCGIDHKTLLPKSERPAVVKKTPQCYTEQEMDKFFFVIMNERDKLFFELLLKTGAREQEAAQLEWSDLKLGINPTVIFRIKEGFRTKNGKSRTVPLERSLAEKLTLWCEKHPASRYVFPREDGEASKKFLVACKRYARRAGLNCGKCKGCTARDECKNYFLHKFRHSFASWSLRRGIDIRTVQHWLGHSSIEMTLRYLSPEEGDVAQNLMNNAWGSVVGNVHGHAAPET
jgi:integrase